MAKVFVVTAAELDQLVQELELSKLRLGEHASDEKRMVIQDTHRAMHYRVVKWVQDVAGHKGS